MFTFLLHEFSHENCSEFFPENYWAFYFVGPKKILPNFPPKNQNKITDELLQESRENTLHRRRQYPCLFYPRQRASNWSGSQMQGPEMHVRQAKPLTQRAAMLLPRSKTVQVVVVIKPCSAFFLLRCHCRRLCQSAGMLERTRDRFRKLKTFQYSERQKRHQILAPVLVIISGNSLVFSRIFVYKYWFLPVLPDAVAPVVVKICLPRSKLFILHSKRPHHRKTRLQRTKKGK